jgi:hypothetical protein
MTLDGVIQTEEKMATALSMAGGFSPMLTR